MGRIRWRDASWASGGTPKDSSRQAIRFIHSRLYPSHSGQEDKGEKKKLRINWRQCDTSDTVGPSIASKRQGPEQTKIRLIEKQAPEGSFRD